uniref:Bacterial transcriptional activator domain-containing protein n=1 Tax=Meiothermus ruber TaxID=277 RepID=A0A7C3DV55_MEIRU
MPDRKRLARASEPLETAPPRGRLEVLGVPTLHIQNRQLRPLERKTAGLLAYLSLEGSTSRSKLAGLLWPESTESTARNNLAQALRRLKQAAGAEVVRGGDVLELLGLTVDVALLQVAHFAGRHLELAEARGVLLEGCDYDDCPDFDDWLLVQREKLAELRRMSLAALSDGLEQAGQYREALAYAERLLEQDLLSEVAHRRVMRLLYLSGDRPAALKAYERCQTVLKRELGVAPLAETQMLAAQITQGAGLEQSAPPQKSAIPLSLLRPPVMVGREKLWAQMEEAYQKGQVVLLRGEPGVGKTRLALDFAASKGQVVLLAARPGDAGVPYSSYARSLRESFAERPELLHSLPAWVRREVARILPELVQDALPPLLSEAEKLRFYDALAELTLYSHSGDRPSIQVSDDAQYLDRASLEAMQYQLNKYGRVGGQGQPPFTIEIYRREEIAPEVEQGIFLPLVEAGLAVLLDVEPLQAAEVEALVQSLEVPGLASLSQTLVRYTGGNPFFVLETARSLVESGALQKGVPQKLPASGRVRTLIKARLEGLSPPAQRLIRTAAVAGPDFSPELAASVLEATPWELLEPWAELEAAQMLRGNAFTHDLLYEATLGGIPASIKAYLHRQTAAYLEGVGADPARIAGHWLGGEPARAVPFLVQAARRAEEAYRLTEAAQFYEQALEHAGEAQAFDLLEALSRVMVRFDTGQRHARLIERMQTMADTPEKQARAWLCESIRQAEHGYGLEAEVAARQGLQAAEQAGLTELRIRLLDSLAQSLYVQRKTPALVEALEQLRQLHRERGDVLQAAICTSRLGIAYDQLERHREALAYYQEAEPVLERSENRIMRVGFHHNRAVCLAALGYGEAALEAQLQAGRLLEGMQGATGREVHHLNNLALRYYDLERYAEAQQALERALEIVPEEWGWTRAFSEYQMARLHWVWGAWDAASDWLNRALGAPDLPRRDEATYRILGLLLAHRRGEEVGSWIEKLGELFDGQQGQAYGRFLLAKARILPDEAPVYLKEALALAQERDLPALQISAHTLLAETLLCRSGSSRGGLKEAQAHAQAAIKLLESYWPTGCSKLEVLWVHCCVQTASLPADLSLIEQVLGYLMRIAENEVPSQHRSSFLSQNPLSQAILQAARSAGLSIL